MLKVIEVKQAEFTKNIITMISGAGLAQLITMMSSVVITRLYSPGDFGIAALVLSVGTVLSVFSTLRFNQAIVVASHTVQAQSLVKLCLYLSCITSSLVFLCLLIYEKILYQGLFLNKGMSILFYVIPLQMLLVGVYDAFGGWTTRHKYFHNYALSNIASSITSALSKISSGIIFGGGAVFLIVGSVIANIVSISVISKCTDNTELKAILFSGKGRLLVVAKRFKDFPIYNLTSGLLNKGGKFLPIFVLGFLYEPLTVGYFALAFNITRMPVGVVGENVKKVYIQKASDLFSTGAHHQLRRLSIRLMYKLAIIAFLPVTFLMFWGAELFGFVFGEEWAKAGDYARFLAPWLFVWLISVVSFGSIVVYRQQRILLYYQKVMILLRFFALYFGAMFGGASSSIIAFSAVSVAGLVFIIIVSMVILKKH